MTSGAIANFRWYQILLVWAAGWVVLIMVIYAASELWRPADSKVVLIPWPTNVATAITAVKGLWMFSPGITLFLILALVFNAAMLVWLLMRIGSRLTPA